MVSSIWQNCVNGIRKGFTGDGSLATKAELNHPYGVAVETSGNLILTDTVNNRIRVVMG